MQGEGAGEVTLLAIRGQLLRSSIFRLDSVLSARVLMLLNTTGRPPLWRYVGLQPCVNEVNIQWPHAWPNADLGVTLEITLSDAKSWRSPFLGDLRSLLPVWLTICLCLCENEDCLLGFCLFMWCNVGSQMWTGRSNSKTWILTSHHSPVSCWLMALNSWLVQFASKITHHAHTPGICAIYSTQIKGKCQ